MAICPLRGGIENQCDEIPLGGGARRRKPSLGCFRLVSRPGSSRVRVQKFRRRSPPGHKNQTTATLAERKTDSGRSDDPEGMQINS